MRIIQSCFFALIFAGLPGAAHAQSAPAAQQTKKSDQSQPPSPTANAEGDPAQEAAKLVKLTREWVEGKLSTPGVSLKSRQFANKIENGELLVQYNVTVKGAPSNQPYLLMAWPLNESHAVEQLRGLSISSDGLVICGSLTAEQCGLIETKQKFDLMDFTFYPAKGEIFRLALVSPDEKTKIFFTMVPAPILKKDKSCSLEVVRLMPKFEVAMIRAKGFQPSEDLQFASIPSGDLSEPKPKADANGEYVSALLPFVKDKKSGKTIVTLKGVSCAPSISFEWGK